MAAVVVALVSILLLSGIPAAAHVDISITHPSANATLADPPETIRLRFGTPVDRAEVSAVLARASGAQARHLRASTAARTLTREVELPVGGDLDEGSYALTVTARGLDGHTVSDKFYFAVGDAPLVTEGAAASASSTAPAGVRAVAVLADLGEVLGLAGLMAAAPFTLLFPGLRMRRSARRLVFGAAGLCGLATACALIAHGPLTEGRGVGADLLPMLRDTLGTSTGRLQALRLSALVVFALVYARLGARTSPGRENALVLSGLVILLTFAGTTHAAGAPLPMLAIGVAVVHLGAVSLWAGTLAALTLANLSPGYAASPQCRRGLATLIRAIPVVAGLGVVSGSLLTLLVTDGLDARAVLGGYGAMLAIKVIAVAVALLLGWRTRTAILAHARRGTAAGRNPSDLVAAGIMTRGRPQPVSVLTRPEVSADSGLLPAVTVELFVIALVLLCASGLSSWVTL